MNMHVINMHGTHDDSELAMESASRWRWMEEGKHHPGNAIGGAVYRDLWQEREGRSLPEGHLNGLGAGAFPAGSERVSGKAVSLCPCHVSGQSHDVHIGEEAPRLALGDPEVLGHSQV